MKEYTQENLINHLSILKGNNVCFLIGAGCSINSGCMAADKLTQEFKKRIYFAKEGLSINDNELINDVKLMEIVNARFPSNMGNPYSYYFEKCFPNSSDRSVFIKEHFQNIKPSHGYLCFANYLINNAISLVLTTNFDNLIEKSVWKIDESYDMTLQSDDVIPKLSSKLNVIKLHGDYNYDCLRNTADELEALSERTFDSLMKSNIKEIIVIGYSGADNSVMEFLRELSKRNVKILWCTIKQYHKQNSEIEDLFLNNGESGYCFIEGFDELFDNIYHFQGENNAEINNLYKEQNNHSLQLAITNQPEKIVYNINPLINNPSCYKFNCSLSSEEIAKFNDDNSNAFIMQHKGWIYYIGDKDSASLSKLSQNALVEIKICDEDISVGSKCRLLKEALKLYAKSQGLCVFKNNIYEKTFETIQEGLEVAFELFDGHLCLVTNVNYFSLSSPVDEILKKSINGKKSNLYASDNYIKRGKMLKMLFPNGFFASFCNTVLKFDSVSQGNIDSKSKIYECSDEPEMQVDSNHSVNQISLLNEFGPRRTLYSGQKIKVGVFCPVESVNKLKQFMNLLVNGTNKINNYGNIVPEFKGFKNVFGKDLEMVYDGLPDFSISRHLEKLTFIKFSEFCLRGIKRLYEEKMVDIVLIYIPKRLSKYKSEGELDLHDIIKLRCVNAFKTQFLEEETIDSSDDINKKIFNLGMGIYTKTIGMPWYPRKYSRDTLFLGMSFGVDNKGITVGCSQMFDGAGRGMQLILSKVTDKHRKNQYLSLEEAYKLGIKIRSTYYKTSKIDELKRIVIHRSNPFKQEEIEGFKKAFEGIEDFDLIQISDHQSFNGYSFQNNKCNGFPVRRGTIIKCSKDMAYIWTDGSVKSPDILGGRTYRNNKRGMGRPLKIKKFCGNITLNEIADDLMFLTKMDFNSSDVIYSKLPVTIKYSQVVCDLLKQGSFVDELISFEYIM